MPELTFEQRLLVAMTATTRHPWGVLDRFRTDEARKLEKVLYTDVQRPDSCFWLAHLLIELRMEFDEQKTAHGEIPSNAGVALERSQEKSRVTAHQHNAVLELLKSRLSSEDAEKLEFFWEPL